MDILKFLKTIFTVKEETSKYTTEIATLEFRNRLENIYRVKLLERRVIYMFALSSNFNLVRYESNNKYISCF